MREGSASLVALPGNGKLTVEYHLDYEAHNGSGGGQKQIVAFELSPESFEREIAPARTFVFEHEVEALQAAGLGKGASPQNTLVVGPDGLRLAKRHGDTSLRHFREQGVRTTQVVGHLAALSGLRPPGTECTPRELLDDFDLRRVPRHAVDGAADRPF